MLSSSSAEEGVGVWLQPPLHAIPHTAMGAGIHVRVKGDVKEAGDYKRTDRMVECARDGLYFGPQREEELGGEKLK